MEIYYWFLWSKEEEKKEEEKELHFPPSAEPSLPLPTAWLTD